MLWLSSAVSGDEGGVDTSWFVAERTAHLVQGSLSILAQQYFWLVQQRSNTASGRLNALSMKGKSHMPNLLAYPLPLFHTASLQVFFVALGDFTGEFGKIFIQVATIFVAEPSDDFL
jgi:hypothetical protein